MSFPLLPPSCERIDRPQVVEDPQVGNARLPHTPKAVEKCCPSEYWIATALDAWAKRLFAQRRWD